MKNYIKGLVLAMIFASGASPLEAQEVSTTDSVTISQPASTPARIEQVTKDFYINLDYYDKYPSYERLCDRQWHLKGWSRFCNIYGWICTAVGCFDLAVGIAEDAPYSVAIGSLCAAEGIAVVAVGGSLRAKCKKTRAEITRINTVGFPTSQLNCGTATLVPSINLIADNATHDNALGVGLRIEF